MRNPCELQIELFCRGLRVDDALGVPGRGLFRTRAGLGSGLDLAIPAGGREIWVNAPVVEPFARASPFRLVARGAGHAILDERDGEATPVRVPPRPAWYDRRTSRGARMCEIGVLQGTYLGVYVGGVCRFWSESLQCKFCSTGLNVGSRERLVKSVEDVVEVCRATREEDGTTFVHFNTGKQEGSGLDVVEPYVRAVRRRTGLLVGVQVLPERDLDRYDRLVDAGADHFSFCYEFHDPETFARLCPGKARDLGQRAFFDALEYTARRLGKGRVSGEIIAGLEPVESTLRAIDYIASVGAFPTVCVFRPLLGTPLADLPPPPFPDMLRVMRHVYAACRRHGIPIGIAENVEVSLVCQPTDTMLLARGGLRDRLYRAKLWAMRAAARPRLRRRLAAR